MEKGMDTNNFPKVKEIEYENAPEWIKYLREDKPFVLKNSDIAKPAIDANWNLDYLIKHSNPDDVYNVLASNDLHCYSNYSKSNKLYSFRDEVKVLKITAKKLDTLMKINNMQNNEKNKNKSTDNKNKENKNGGKKKMKFYLQQFLFVGMGKQITKDFQSFKWDVLSEFSNIGKFGDLTKNLLLIGEKGCVTPCHYDEQENLFAHISGRKKVVLFAPDAFPYLYTYPSGHPCDRQCRVGKNIEYGTIPDHRYYPDFMNAAEYGQVTVLEPGDIMFIPALWFHHISSPWESTTSLSFWYHQKKSIIPVTKDQKKNIDFKMKFKVIRNIEQMVFDNFCKIGRKQDNYYFWKGIGRNNMENFTENMKSEYSNLVKMLSHVFDNETEIKNFLIKNFRHRFDGIELA